MKKQEERRKWPREILPRPEVGIVYPQHDEDVSESAHRDRQDSLMVDVLNWSESGLLFESKRPFKVGSLLGMRIRLPHKEVWIPFKARVVRIDESPNKKDYYRLAVELHHERPPENFPTNKIPSEKETMCRSDFDCPIAAPLSDTLSDKPKCPLLN
ncbi:MAG TPA: PilZ domain-containing protein, partial [Desulfobacterales bacterium]|nr:PilZ domain-containing protein [Desulfobacterales bacterium]